MGILCVLWQLKNYDVVVVKRLIKTNVSLVT